MVSISPTFLLFLVVTFSFSSSLSVVQALAQKQSLLELSLKPSASFSTALEALQNEINYTFKSDGLLRRAMTHASFSEENNKALSVLGASIIESSAAQASLNKDLDISAKDLNLIIANISNVETSCNADGTRLGLQSIVRVSRRTNATAPSVICGAFRAIFGAISIDAGSLNEAGKIFLQVDMEELQQVPLCR